MYIFVWIFMSFIEITCYYMVYTPVYILLIKFIFRSLQFVYFLSYTLKVNNIY